MTNWILGIVEYFFSALILGEVHKPAISQNLGSVRLQSGVFSI